MENEEAEDLLIDVSEESDSVVSDYCIQEKVVRLFEADQNKAKSWTTGWALIFASVLLFLSASVVLITLPVYIEQSSRCGIKVYSKFATLASYNLVLFCALFAAKKLLKRKCTRFLKPTNRLYMCLPSVLKTSFLLSAGSLAVFWLANEGLVSCHLQDPLKGCVVVFSLVFYFIFSKRSELSWFVYGVWLVV